MYMNFPSQEREFKKLLPPPPFLLFLFFDRDPRSLRAAQCISNTYRVSEVIELNISTL